MKKYILADGSEDTDVALLWKNIPEDAIELIKKDSISKVLFYKPEEGVIRQTAVFLREVGSFKKGMKKFELTEDITIGV